MQYELFAYVCTRHEQVDIDPVYTLASSCLHVCNSLLVDVPYVTPLQKVLSIDPYVHHRHVTISNSRYVKVGTDFCMLYV